MIESRTKNVSRNITYGMINKIVSLLLPFISRTLMLYLVGTTSVGVSTLFSSILSFLSLAELGFGAAVVYSMYKPVANDDVDAIGALLKYYRRLYKFIGTVVLVIGAVLSPFLPFLIKGDAPPNVNIYVLYYLYLLNSVVSYFFAGYRQSLLTAYQRADVKDKISLAVTIGVRLGEIFAIYFTRNLYIYVGVSILGTLTTNLLTFIATKRMYPEIECKGDIALETKIEIRKKLGGLFGTKLNSIVVHQADSIVISAFLGLTLLAQYGNYHYIISALSGFVMILFSSMTASIGNKIATDSISQVYILFKRINFLNNWLVGWISICLMCLYHPFMILWVKEELTLPVFMSFCMTLYFYIYQIQRTVLTFKDAGGLWYEDRYRPYISMVFNVVSNIVLVQIIGIYGVVVSTILAFMISLPWCNYVLFTKLFHMSAIKNIISMIINLITTSIICCICYGICYPLPISILGIAIRVLICILLPNSIYVLIFWKNEEFTFYKGLLIGIICRRCKV